MVHVLGRRHTLGDDHQALPLDGGPDAVEDEAVALTAHVERDESVPRQLRHQRRDDVLVGAAGGHEFHGVQVRRHLVVRVQDPLDLVNLVDQLTGRERRRIAGQDRVGGGEPVQRSEDLDLQVAFLRYRFDDQPRPVDRPRQVGGGLYGTGVRRRQAELPPDPGACSMA